METYESIKNWLSGAMSTIASPFQSAVPAVATTQGATSLFGTSPEPSGYTSTGGKRHRHRKGPRKTRKHRR